MQGSSHQIIQRRVLHTGREYRGLKEGVEDGEAVVVVVVVVAERLVVAAERLVVVVAECQDCWRRHRQGRQNSLMFSKIEEQRMVSVL